MEQNSKLAVVGVEKLYSQPLLHDVHSKQSVAALNSQCKRKLSNRIKGVVIVASPVDAIDIHERSKRRIRLRKISTDPPSPDALMEMARTRWRKGVPQELEDLMSEAREVEASSRDALQSASETRHKIASRRSNNVAVRRGQHSERQQKHIKSHKQSVDNVSNPSNALSYQLGQSGLPQPQVANIDPHVAQVANTDPYVDRASSHEQASRVSTARTRSTARGRNIDCLVPPQMRPQSAAELYNLNTDSRQPGTYEINVHLLDPPIPFATPFRGKSASLLRRPKPPPPRPHSAEPMQMSAQLTKPEREEKITGKVGEEGPEVLRRRLYEQIAESSIDYHHRRCDITSKQQFRSAYGTTLRAWAEKQDTQAQKEKENTAVNVQNSKSSFPIDYYRRPRNEDDWTRKKAEQKEFAKSISMAHALNPERIPISFEPMHSSMPMKRGQSNEWAWQTIYLPKTISRWNAANEDPPFRDHVRERPTWGPHDYSN